MLSPETIKRLLFGGQYSLLEAYVWQYWWSDFLNVPYFDGVIALRRDNFASERSNLLQKNLLDNVNHS